MNNFWQQYAIAVRRNLEMFYRMYANKQYAGTINFEFDEREFIFEGKPYYASGEAIIEYEAESDDFGREAVQDYTINSLHNVDITDYEGNDVSATPEIIKEIVKVIDDTPSKQSYIYEAIFQDIDFSMRD